MYKPHPEISHAPDLEEQNLNKKLIIWSFSRVVLLQTTKDKKSKFQNTNIAVVAIFNSYQV